MLTICWEQISQPDNQGDKVLLVVRAKEGHIEHRLQ